jgi:hypothetical protein
MTRRTTTTRLLFVLLTACSADEEPTLAASIEGDGGNDAEVSDAALDSGATLGPDGCAQFDSSFAALEKLIFERHGCTADACHGEKMEGGLDLRAGAAYQSLVDAPAKGQAMARVQPGTANESYLYLKLRAATEPGSVEIAGSPMPVAQAPLTERELEAIELWIKKGAPETGFAADGVTRHDVGSLLDACAQPLEPVLVKPLEAPAADEGIQFLLPSYELGAQSEIQNCTAFAYDFTDKVPPEFKDEARNVMFVNGARVRQDTQSHHLVLYDNNRSLDDLTGDLSSWTCREGENHGGPCDPRKGSADCGEQGVCADLAGSAFSPSCLPFSSDTDGFSPQLANTQAPQEYIPPIDGVYWEIPLSGVLSFNSHAFNLTDQSTTLHARVNFYYTKNLDRKLVPTNVTANNRIAAGQAPFTRQTYCAEYTVAQGDSITVMTFHTHRRGEHSWVNHPTMGMIYENFDYNDPLYKRFDPWLDFDSPDPADRTLEYCATYNNGLLPNDDPDVDLVRRASRMPEGAACTPEACVSGKVTAACSTHADCDSEPGAGDGSCDACPITGGVTTEDEMFVLMPWIAKPAAE